tara:strand:- start:652 stop:990 length:339 start_codon:yes stop_codon:yes gene_type:complete
MNVQKSNRFLADFGINSAEILSQAISKASESSWKHNHSIVPETIISNSIVLSSSLFGAIYLFSTSLVGLNKKWNNQDKHTLSVLDGINTAIMGISGYIIIKTSQRAFEILQN